MAFRCDISLKDIAMESEYLKIIKQLQKDRQAYLQMISPATFGFIKQLQKDRQAYLQMIRPTTFGFIKQLEKDRGTYLRNILSSPAFRMIISGPNEKTFIREIIDRIETLEDRNEHTLNETLWSVKDSLVNQCKKLKPKTTNFVGISQLFEIILFLLSIAITSHITDESENKIVEQFQNMQRAVYQQIESLKPEQETEEINYVVFHEVNLRGKPTTKSTPLEVLSKNQVVTLLNEKGKWIYIEYFDYVDGMPKKGWVFKKYLKRMNQ